LTKMDQSTGLPPGKTGRTGKIIYWIATLWLALGMISTGAGQLLKAKDGQGGADMITHLGYTVYLLTFVDLEHYILVFQACG
jgi:uncharacterized membrane protein YhaH (DUF805 family)